MYMPEQPVVWKIEVSAEDQVSVFSSGLHKQNSAAKIEAIYLYVSTLAENITSHVALLHSTTQSCLRAPWPNLLF